MFFSSRGAALATFAFMAFQTMDLLPHVKAAPMGIGILGGSSQGFVGDPFVIKKRPFCNAFEGCGKKRSESGIGPSSPAEEVLAELLASDQGQLEDWEQYLLHGIQAYHDASGELGRGSTEGRLGFFKADNKGLFRKRRQT